MNMLARIAALVVIMAATTVVGRSEAYAAEVAPPVAADDRVAVVYAGVPVFIDALANDVDPQELELSIVSFDDPSIKDAITVTIADGGLQIVVHKKAIGRIIYFNYKISNGTAFDNGQVQLKVRPFYDVQTKVIRHSERKPGGGRTAGKIRLTNRNGVPLYFRWYDMDSGNQLKVRGRITVPALSSAIIRTRIRSMSYNQFVKIEGEKCFLSGGTIFHI